MPIPISYVLGLLCLFSGAELLGSLPLDPGVGRLAPWLPLLALPYILARLGFYRVPEPRHGGRLAALLVSLPRLVPRTLAVPAVFFALLEYGGLLTLIEHHVHAVVHSGTLSFGLALAVLIVLEASADIGALQAALRQRRIGELPPQSRLRWIAFVTVPVLLFQVGLDLVSLSRELEVFALGTGIGVLLGLFLLIAVLMLALPIVFRRVMAVSDDVPEDVRQTAQLLDFPKQDVLQLHTDERMVNAALVGPLPRFRFLFLTDGLLRVLDPVSLCGVVAHEVGHARANHPMLLFVLFLVVPLLFLHPLEALGFSELDEGTQLLALGVVMLAGIAVLNRVAHRFELEADQLSCDALGGAMPCILALQKVGALFGESVTRSSLRHPSEERRIDHLLRCDGDPWYREQFVRKGRRLRHVIVALLVLAFAANLWSQTHLWRFDAMVYTFYTGQFAATEQALAALPPTERASLPPMRAEFLRHLEEEVRAARTLYPDGGRWAHIREDLAARAWKRGRAELLNADADDLRTAAARARPWFSLGLSKRAPTAAERSLYHLAAAAAAEERARFEEVRAHLLAEFALDAGLAQRLRG